MNQNQTNLNSWYNSVIQAGQAKPLHASVAVPKLVAKRRSVVRPSVLVVPAKLESFDSILGTVFND
jgi:hypothetical protein